MNVLHVLRHPFSLTQDLASKKIIKQFAHKFDFVYFGFVDHQEDEHELVRGITLSATHVDNHFTVGHFQGHDVTIVDRQNTLTFPDKQPQHYKWTIMQIDMKRTDLPHVFVDANHHDELFYANLFAKFANFTNATSLFMVHDQLFAHRFKVFTPPDRYDAVESLFTPDITAMLAHHFSQFDYELSGDHLLVYATNTPISIPILQEMLRVGVWLADHFNVADVTP